MSDLKPKSGLGKGGAAAANKLKGKDVDNVETMNGPQYSTAKKGSSSTDPASDEKFMKSTNNGKNQKGKVSGEDKSSGDSDNHFGPVLK
jgi:hypothetical protein